MLQARGELAEPELAVALKQPFLAYLCVRTNTLLIIGETLCNLLTGLLTSISPKAGSVIREHLRPIESFSHPAVTASDTPINVF